MTCAFARCSDGVTALVVDRGEFGLLFRHNAGLVCEAHAVECEQHHG